MNHSSSPIDHIESLLKGQRLVMLAHLAEDGSLRSKPMTVVEHEPGGSFWFLIRSFGDRTAEDAEYARVNLAILNEGEGAQISISGHGRIERDRGRIRALWTAAAKPFFPGGVDDPELAALEVIPGHAEYWDGPDSAIGRGLAMAASVVASRPVGLGSHGSAHYARSRA